VRPFGLPIDLPVLVVSKVLSDLGAIATAARETPAKLDRVLALGEDIASTGRALLELAERLDERAERVLELGTSLDRRADDLLRLGVHLQALGERIDARGAEIVDRAAGVVETGGELIAMLPTLERALDMATPLEGAIDRFGRLVDRLPGGAPRRRPDA
jgi:transposase